MVHGAGELSSGHHLQVPQGVQSVISIFLSVKSSVQLYNNYEKREPLTVTQDFSLAGKLSLRVMVMCIAIEGPELTLARFHLVVHYTKKVILMYLSMYVIPHYSPHMY